MALTSEQREMLRQKISEERKKAVSESFERRTKGQSKEIKAIKCPTCGSTFTSNKTGKKYCSYECRRKIGSTKPKRQIVPKPVVYTEDDVRTCPLCDSLNEPTAKTCQECGTRLTMKLRQRQKDALLRNLPRCGYCGRLAMPTMKTCHVHSHLEEN